MSPRRHDLMALCPSTQTELQSAELNMAWSLAAVAPPRSGCTIPEENMQCVVVTVTARHAQASNRQNIARWAFGAVADGHPAHYGQARLMQLAGCLRTC